MRIRHCTQDLRPWISLSIKFMVLINRAKTSWTSRSRKKLIFYTIAYNLDVLFSQLLSVFLHKFYGIWKVLQKSETLREPVGAGYKSSNGRWSSYIHNKISPIVPYTYYLFIRNNCIMSILVKDISDFIIIIANASDLIRV